MVNSLGVQLSFPENISRVQCLWQATPQTKNVHKREGNDLCRKYSKDSRSLRSTCREEFMENFKCGHAIRTIRKQHMQHEVNVNWDTEH